MRSKTPILCSHILRFPQFYTVILCFQPNGHNKNVSRIFWHLQAVSTKMENWGFTLYSLHIQHDMMKLTQLYITTSKHILNIISSVFWCLLALGVFNKERLQTKIDGKFQLTCKFLSPSGALKQ
jgi:hypothetical protein